MIKAKSLTAEEAKIARAKGKYDLVKTIGGKYRWDFFVQGEEYCLGYHSRGGGWCNSELVYGFYHRRTSEGHEIFLREKDGKLEVYTANSYVTDWCGGGEDEPSFSAVSCGFGAEVGEGPLKDKMIGIIKKKREEKYAKMKESIKKI